MTRGRAAWPLGVFAWAAAGTLLCTLVFLGDFPWWPTDQATDRFTGTPEFYFWMFVACAQGAVWGILLRTLLNAARRAPPEASPTGGTWIGDIYKRFWRQLVFPTVLFGLLIVVFAIASVQMSEVPLPGVRWKVLLLSIVPVALALTAGVGIWLLHAGLVEGRKSSADSGTRLVQYLWFRDQLRILLLVEATLLSVQIVGAASMRNAVTAGSSVPFPQGWVVLFGAFYSALLALAYGPAHFYLLAVGNELRDEFFPTEPPDAPKWLEWFDRRTKFGEFLELQAPAAPAFRVVGAVLSPLLTSIVAAALESAA